MEKKMKAKKQVRGISAVLCLVGYTLLWLAVGLLANGCTVESSGETEWGSCTCAPPPKAPEYPSELRVERLVLVDDEGRERAVLAMSEGNPKLALFDEAGNTRVGLGAEDSGSSLLLSDAVGTTRIALAPINNIAGVAVFDAAGEMRVLLGMGKDNPGLILANAAGNTTWSAP